MKRPTRRYLLLGISAYLLFLIATLPAQFVFQYIPLAGSKVQVSGIEGTIWSGEITQLTIHDLSLKKVSWDITPLSLLWGELSADIRLFSRNQPSQTRVGIDYSGNISLSDLKASISTHDLATAAGFGYLHLSGNLTTEIDELQISGRTIQVARGEINWKSASFSLLNETYELGNLNLNLTTTNDTITGQAKDLTGPLLIDGLIKLTGGNYQADIQLASKGDSPQLERLLSMSGRKNANGRYQFKRSGRLPL